jgi:hydrogenase nickel incorporation protein HypA/HybF
MHEFSIAEAIIEQVARHAPPGAIVRSATVEAGPMRGIEPDAMQWAWQAATDGTALAGATLNLVALPWTLRCPSCGTLFEAVEMFEPCKCGCERTMPEKCDVLRLISIDVDDPPDGAVSNGRNPDHAGSHC